MSMMKTASIDKILYLFLIIDKTLTEKSRGLLHFFSIVTSRIICLQSEVLKKIYMRVRRNGLPQKKKNNYKPASIELYHVLSKC